MQTFLPFADYLQSAKLLDKRRCWKQVVEASQIINVLSGDKKGWRNHPAVQMWRDYENSLDVYYNTFYDYCVSHHKIKAVKLQPRPLHLYAPYPEFIGSRAFHQSHINNLARKAIAELNIGRPELYDNMVAAGLNPNEQDVNGEYVWPVKQ